MEESQPELLDAEGKFKAILAVNTKKVEGICDELRHGVLIHNQTVRAVSNFHQLHLACQKIGEKKNTSLSIEQDLLRAMLLFACSGLDAVVKQLIEDALECVLHHDDGAQREFQKFVERRLKKGGISEDQDRSSASVFDARLMSELLVSFDPRTALISILRRHLTSDSLQSRDQLLKVAAHFALTREDIMSAPDVTKAAFEARNQIVHEMDIDLETGNQRRERDYPTLVRWSENIIAISAAFIDKVALKVASPSPQEDAAAAMVAGSQS